MAKTKDQKEAEKMESKPKDGRLRISLRIKDSISENFLKQMGQVQRAMFIELAIIKYIREGNPTIDDSFRLLTRNIRGVANTPMYPMSSDMPMAAKQMPAAESTPVITKTSDVTDDNYNDMGIG